MRLGDKGIREGEITTTPHFMKKITKSAVRIQIRNAGNSILDYRLVKWISLINHDHKMFLPLISKKNPKALQFYHQNQMQSNEYQGKISMLLSSYYVLQLKIEIFYLMSKKLLKIYHQNQ